MQPSIHVFTIVTTLDGAYVIESFNEVGQEVNQLFKGRNL